MILTLIYFIYFMHFMKSKNYCSTVICGVAEACKASKGTVIVYDDKIVCEYLEIKKETGGEIK